MAAIRMITVAVLACLAAAVPLGCATPARAGTDVPGLGAAGIGAAGIGAAGIGAAGIGAAGIGASGAAALAAAQGFRTGVAVLDLSTGGYTGAGDDAGLFPSESVVKVLIATQLLLSGQMTGATDALARRMITASDDAAADQLYVRAGSATVLPSVAAHYGISGLGTPTAVPGRWGLTQITAKGMVQLYAAIARDPAVQPWLGDTMAHASPTASDGTAQFFGLRAAAPDAAIKQGWGHDGVGGGQAVANSTGYVDGGRFAVAILTEGPPASYLTGITALVTAQAQALVGGGAPAAAPPSPAAVPTSTAAAPVPAVEPLHTRTDLRPVLLVVAGLAGAGLAGVGLQCGVRRIRLARAGRRERLRRQALRRRLARAATGAGSPVVVRLPSGQLVRLGAGRPPHRTGRATTRPAVGHPRSGGPTRPRSGAARPAMAVPA